LAAFTLAEVLITLGIIGVVAAMTIPTLISNITCARYKAKFKKAISVLNQAVRQNLATYDYDFATMDGSENTFRNIFVKNMKVGKYGNGQYQTGANTYNTKVYDIGYIASTEYSYITFLDNAEFYYDHFFIDNSRLQGTPLCTKNGTGIYEYMYKGWCIGFIDVNGLDNGPNKEVTCADGKVKRITDSNYTDCTVPNDREHLTDIYPVIFYDSTLIPLTNAAKAVLNGK
jgi:type II secretory pathway pseudopilin PulG